MTTNRSTKENGRPGTNRATTEVTTNLETDSTTNDGARLREVDPLVGWFSLGANAKPSRERTPKKSWTRGAK